MFYLTKVSLNTARFFNGNVFVLFLNSSFVYSMVARIRQEHEYHLRTAKTLKEDAELISADFEFVTERGRVKTYRM